MPVRIALVADNISSQVSNGSVKRKPNQRSNCCLIGPPARLTPSAKPPSAGCECSLKSSKPWGGGGGVRNTKQKRQNKYHMKLVIVTTHCCGQFALVSPRQNDIRHRTSPWVTGMQQPLKGITSSVYKLHQQFIHNR